MISRAEWLKRLVEARAELSSKTMCEIQVDTAYRWAARAIVAYDAGRVRDGDEFAGEAAEHSALGELGGCKGLSTEILSVLQKARRACT
jgi:hypothetical protein